MFGWEPTTATLRTLARERAGRGASEVEIEQKAAEISANTTPADRLIVADPDAAGKLNEQRQRRLRQGSSS